MLIDFHFLLQGAAVLRMLSEFITESVFSKGLHVSAADFTDNYHLNVC